MNCTLEILNSLLLTLKEAEGVDSDGLTDCFLVEISCVLFAWAVVLWLSTSLR